MGIFREQVLPHRECVRVHAARNSARHGNLPFPSRSRQSVRTVPHRIVPYVCPRNYVIPRCAALRCAATRLCRHEPSCVHAYCTPYMKVRVDFFGYGYIQVRYLRMYICAQGSAWGKIISVSDKGGEESGVDYLTVEGYAMGRKIG